MTRLTTKKASVSAIIIALGIGWLSHVFWQRVVALQLEWHGASITFDRTVPIGVNFRRDDSTFSNEQMPLVGRLPHLQWLDLAETHVTDEGLNHVERLPNLISLTVHINQISVERERHLNRQKIGVTKDSDNR